MALAASTRLSGSGSCVPAPRADPKQVVARADHRPNIVDLLVARGVSRFTDLPQSAQEKLLFRKNLRSQWQAVPDPLGDEDRLF